jgi:hypothetical protein
MTRLFETAISALQWQLLVDLITGLKTNLIISLENAKNPAHWGGRGRVQEVKWGE